MSKAIQKLEGTAITQAEEPRKPSEVVEAMLVSRRAQFIQALPSHISFEKFQRTVMTAVLTDPALLQADRQSFMVSALKCASDGLLPDKRESAFVIFNTKIKDQSGKDQWIKAVQYMPMYLGVLKKVRQSGELASVVAHVVYEKDQFNYTLGDQETIVHIPYMGKEERGEVIAAYAIAVLKDGTQIREVMTRQDIEKVRKTSKSGADKDSKEPIGIWRDWYPEMARKTVFRRLSKWLPQSIEIIDEAFKNDESMEILDQVEGSKPSYEIPATQAQAQIEDHSHDADPLAEVKKSRKKEPVPVEIVNDDTGEVSEQAEEQPQQPEESDDQKIEKFLTEAKDANEVYEIWANEWKKEVEALRKSNPERHKVLFELYKKRSAEFQE